MEVEKTMVDATDIYKSDYVNVELVKNSKKKMCVIIGAGKIETDKYGKQRLILPVDMDGEQYDWSLNTATWNNFAEAWGPESKGWLSKQVTLTIEKAHNNNDMVVGHPITKVYSGVKTENIS